MNQSPKLICKNVWKLYGDKPKEFLESHNNYPDQETIKKGRRSKFRSLILNKDFEPAKNLQLEELTENTCKYMDGHPDEKGSSFCGRKNVEKFSYCPLHLMIVFTPKNKKEELVEKEDGVPQFIEKKIKSA